MAGEKTIKRLRTCADATEDMEAVVPADAADKIGRLIAALGSATVALLNKHDGRLVSSARQEIDETLRFLDADL